MEPKKTVCVDLDGVLATYDGWRGLDHIGGPRPGAVEFTRRLSERCLVVIYTTRCKADASLGRGDADTPDALAARVRAWLDRHEFAYDDVYTGQGKPFCAAFVDDRAVPVPPNPTAADFDAVFAAVGRLVS